MNLVKLQDTKSMHRNHDEKSEREIKEILSFTIARKRIKYLGINLPRETKNLYAENYKKLL